MCSLKTPSCVATLRSTLGSGQTAIGPTFQRPFGTRQTVDAIRALIRCADRQARVSAGGAEAPGHARVGAARRPEERSGGGQGVDQPQPRGAQAVTGGRVVTAANRPTRRDQTVGLTAQIPAWHGR
jgi:hypothetical protein